VILGCTELPIVITEGNSPLPFIKSWREDSGLQVWG
jgi:aspartate/glutamate racemase